MSDVVIKLVGVRRVFEDGRVIALDGVDLTVEAGSFVTITGPSGSGKTTLLNLMGAMDLPDDGQVFIDGVTLDERADLDRLRSEKIGFVFQMHNLISVLSAVENVEIPMISPSISRAAKRARALELLERVGLGDRSGSNVRGLSGGERQRVALARALANEPKLLLADEPTGNLDSATGEEVMRLLHELRERTGAALILVTHNEGLCAGADHWVKMRDGKIDGD
jgi:putative ABC transport system ATP-binding protein